VILIRLASNAFSLNRKLFQFPAIAIDVTPHRNVEESPLVFRKLFETTAAIAISLLLNRALAPKIRHV